MLILAIVGVGLFGYHAHQETGSDRAILTILAALCGYAAICGAVQ